MKTQKYNHITRVLVAVGLFSMVIPALAAQVPPGTALAEKQELVRNNGSEPSSLDPHKVESDVENNIISDLFEGLVSVSPTGEIEPRLADKWENKDNTVWTFHLRPGVTWSDGTAITAQDIVWSWQRLCRRSRRRLTRATRQYAYRQRCGNRAGEKSARRRWASKR